MPFDPDFQRALEAIKLRAPIEDVVRERVPSLKRKGNRWWACCPFHDEDTPSFSVHPQMGIWHCFGACSEGGDQISFLQKLDALSFIDAVEILAARAGVELPRRRRAQRDPAQDAGLAALQAADEMFQRELGSSAGRPALEYLRERGLQENTLKAFGLGFAPGRRALVRLAQKTEAQRAFLATGLVRQGDDGQPYDFFHQRLTIPIHDDKGRTVGFGARRIDEEGREARGPKYVNTAETDYFHKGRIVYGLDRAGTAMRREGHAILVEGYTDVMAAHQVGLDHVVAVLGTSTTPDHAGLLRRYGARRISLVFDGDEAGRKACLRAMAGLLPLDARIDVVRLPHSQDPCDLLIREGAPAFQAQLEMAQDWFDFLVEGLQNLGGAELAREVDGVLELLMALPKPVHREAQVTALAERLGLPLDSVREQWRALPARRRAREQGAREQRRRGQAPAAAPVERDPAADIDPETRKRMVRAFESIVGAVLVDPSRLPALRPRKGYCPVPELQELATILGALLELYEDIDAVIDAGAVLNVLGEAPARTRVVPLLEKASLASNPQELFEQSMATLTLCDRSIEVARRQRSIRALESRLAQGDASAEEELEAQVAEFQRISKDGAAAPST